ncbi:MAG: AAA family ATPase [Eubacteriales bacterium]|nr:AAA family ATPase [Eubacteriales bacterium]
MLFYEASAKIESCRILEKYLKNNDEERSASKHQEEIWCELEDYAIEYSSEHEYSVVVFVCYIDTDTSNGRVEFRVISKNYKEDAAKHIYGYTEKCGMKIYDFNIRETTYERVSKMKSRLFHLDYDVIDRFFSCDFMKNGERRNKCREINVDTKILKKQLYDKAVKLNCSETLLPELERIFTNRNSTNYLGNPVQYIIICNKNGVGYEIAKIIMAALYKQNRLKSSRIWISGLLTDQDETYGYSYCEASSVGIVIPNIRDIDNEYDKNRLRKAADKMGLMIEEHSSNVLTFVFVKRGSERIKDLIKDSAPNTNFCEIKQNTYRGCEAREYIRRDLIEKNIDESVGDKIDIADDIDYYPDELDARIHKCLGNILCSDIYSQYAEYQTKHIERIKEREGNAYQELKSMIGLNKPKNIIDKIISYYNTREIYRANGMKPPLSAVHMVFTGNPGTAKTTVARLFADIFKDNKILSEGALIEAGRADLVGEYVGQTAPKVKSLFRRAKGNVLFIDEAYSLVDDRRGLYGDEAINTLVQEMENNREDIIVILAGYPDRMQQFLDTNPGLTSRIAFHINFDDYTEEELYEILVSMATKSGVKLSEDVHDKVIEIFGHACKHKDFGNGRFVRNIYEQALMNQTLRIAKNTEQPSEKELRTLVAEDFNDLGIKETAEKERKVIGF